MQTDRRDFLRQIAGVAAGAGGLWAAGPGAAAEPAAGTRIVLLGTKGGPRVGGEGRKNPSTMLMINGVPYLVDCGYGTSERLVAANVPLHRLRYIFLTHLHSDHTLELGSVIYNAWATGLKTKVETWGPPGVNRMMRSYLDYMKDDIDVRIADEGRPDLRGLVATSEFSQPGLVMRNDDVIVTAQRVRHPPLTQSYAYRFETRDRTVVISGDTTYSPELVEFSRGADVLVHEVMYLPGVEALLRRVSNAATLREHLLASHTVTEDVGRVAAQAGVKTLVLTHFVPGDDPSITDENWTEGVRKHYDGRVIVGRDLMVI
jgi:ribonuclease BN (tRNA processing enzyme)